MWYYSIYRLLFIFNFQFNSALNFNPYVYSFDLCSGNWGPHLIIVPTSVMLNWEMELKRWCPGFKILTYFGSQKERKLKRQVINGLAQQISLSSYVLNTYFIHGCCIFC